jgi:c-di-GMP-binding flagellar brake protein YcgR
MKNTEKREYARFACAGSAEVTLSAGTAPLAATILDISKEGCLLTLKVNKLIPAETRLEVSFEVNRLRFRVRGTLKSHRNNGRIGIQFLNVNPRICRQLAELIDEMAGLKRKSSPDVSLPGARVPTCVRSGS